MNKNKYYKVNERKDNSGNTVFTVFACKTLFDKLFGYWIEYDKKNKTLEEAVRQIKNIVAWKIVKDEIVYKEKVK